MYNVPILFVIFNRRDTALQSFESIRRIQPRKLYLAGDGARPDRTGEEEKVRLTRQAIIDRVDWPCEVKTLFSPTNLGCGRGVFTAINWLFENEEQGIIIEDDCIMQESFFPYAEELLARYKDDTRIGVIDGANFLPQVPVPCSYQFSRYPSTLGWASWRRVWKLMDLDMKWRGGPFEESIIANMGYHARDKKLWRYRMRCIDGGDVSAWDWQFYLSLASHNILSVFPSRNLTINIGFGDMATHTTKKGAPQGWNTDGKLSFPLSHPEYVVPFESFDHAMSQSDNTLFNRIKWLFPLWFKNWVKHLVRG